MTKFGHPIFKAAIASICFWFLDIQIQVCLIQPRLQGSPQPLSLRKIGKALLKGCALLTNLAEAIMTMAFLNARKKLLLEDSKCFKFVLSLTAIHCIFFIIVSYVSIIPLFVLLHGLI